MNSVYILSEIIFLSEVAAAFLGCAGGSLCLFAAGYTYANVVRYRDEHNGELDFVEVLRQMSPKSKKDDDELDEDGFDLEQGQGNIIDIDSLGDNMAHIEDY